MDEEDNHIFIAKFLLKAALSCDTPVRHIALLAEIEIPHLTDNECRSIAVEFPIKWEVVRKIFPTKA